MVNYGFILAIHSDTTATRIFWGPDRRHSQQADNLFRLVGGQDPRALLKDHNWIEVRQIGGRGTVNTHIVNDRVAWSGKRDGIRYSLFSANVILSDDKKPDVEKLDRQEPLRRLPMIGEQPFRKK